MPRRNKGATLKWLDKRACWYIVWYDAGRERMRSTGTTDSGEAESALAEFIQERQRGQRPSGPRDPGDVPIAEALTLYGDEHAPTAKDPARIGYAISALLPYWAERTAGDITKETCRGYLRSRERKPGTVRRELGTLQAALNYMHSEGRLTRAPSVWLPPTPRGKDRWLTQSETAGLLNAARTGRSDVRLYLPLFVVIALYTGARKEAILSLRWNQVDLKKRRIHFDDGEEQTNKRKARQPIPPRLFTFLRLARKRGTDIGFVIHDKGAQVKDIGDSNNGSFGGACKRAGLASVTPHTLRHTCGTWMAQKGVPLWQIGGWLGHTDSRTTELYAHHHPDHLKDAMEAANRR